MASIIKNQIIKHLSAFARNLKPEQISVEVLRGKGQLRNLELNEEVLAERLELPPWLKIVKAHCSSVSVKIPWTKLKSAPVQLFIEEIRVTIRLVASAIPNRKKLGVTIGKHYDLAERVIEGISLHVQSIEVYFETDSQSNVNFGGSIMFSQFVLESRTPHWQEERNINMTRIHDKTIHQVLFFKHINWRVLKIEASANLKTEENFGLDKQQGRSSLNSPLRFLTENGRVRIAIKKNTLDCSLIAGRIELILEEIHWLAYMAHLRSAIDFYKHILDLANSVGKEMPISIVKQQNAFTPNPSPNPQLVQSNLFRQIDIPQSSHHLIISRIDLHLCDDASSTDLPTDWNIDCGAMQAIVQKLRIDFYPENAVFERMGDFSNRQTWLRYSSPNPFTDLVKMQLDQHFRIMTSKMEPNLCDRFVRTWPQLVSQNVIIRIENLIIQSVSERTTKKDALKSLLSMNKRAKEKLPQTISFFHLEVSSYNFPATNAYPLPPDSIHLVLAPMELAPDPKSIRWLVYAFENILNSFDTPQISSFASSPKTSQMPEIRFEFIMPKIILLPNENLPPILPSTDSPKSATTVQTDHRFPKRFILNASTATLSNFVLHNDAQVPLPVMFKNGPHKEQMEFIRSADVQCFGNGVGILQEEFELRTKQFDGMNSLLERLNGTSAGAEWFISIPSLWVNSDFGPDTWELPMLSDLNIFGCIVSRENGSPAGNCILLEPRTDIGIALDHFQFVQFLELIEKSGILMDQIASDRQFFRKHLQNLQKDLPLSIYCQCEKIHLRLILPSGPAPSPYDLKWTNVGNQNIISPSNTSNSCSDLPIDEITNAQIAKKMAGDSAKGSSSALFALDSAAMKPNSSLTAETIGGIAVQGGLKTIESIGGISDITVSGKLPLEMQVSKKQLVGTANLPDFGIAPTPSDLESNLDETLSITTSTSAEQIIFDGTTITADDEIFDDADEVVEAEEALESNSSEKDIRILRRKEKMLGKEMNVFDLMLDDFNIHLRAHCGQTNAIGFAKKRVYPTFSNQIYPKLDRAGQDGRIECIYVNERLRLNCGTIYAEKGVTFQIPKSFDKLKLVEEKLENTKNPLDEAKLKITVNSDSAQRQSLIKLGINGINICLSDEVVSQLAPFIQNPSEEENPSALEISLEECKIEIKDPKKRFPLRIKIGQISIEDGPSYGNQCD